MINNRNLFKKRIEKKVEKKLLIFKQSQQNTFLQYSYIHQLSRNKTVFISYSGKKIYFTYHNFINRNNNNLKNNKKALFQFYIYVSYNFLHIYI